MLAALDNTADKKLTGFALRLVLSDHLAIPREDQPDLLPEAEQLFVPKKPKAEKAKGKCSSHKAQQTKPSTKKEAVKKAAVALWPRIRPGPFCLQAQISPGRHPFGFSQALFPLV